MDPIDRIRKLRRLAQSPNEHEAAAARAEAARLIARHGLTEHEIAPVDDETTLLVDRTVEFSRENLARACAAAHGCESYTGTRGIAIRGLRTSAQAAQRLYNYLCGIPENAVLVGAPPVAQALYRECFWSGFVSAIEARLVDRINAVRRAAETAPPSVTTQRPDAAAAAYPGRVVVMPFNEYQRTRAELAAQARATAAERLAAALPTDVNWVITGEVITRGHETGKRAGLTVILPPFDPPSKKPRE